MSGQATVDDEAGKISIVHAVFVMIGLATIPDDSKRPRMDVAATDHVIQCCMRMLLGELSEEILSARRFSVLALKQFVRERGGMVTEVNVGFSYRLTEKVDFGEGVPEAVMVELESLDGAFRQLLTDSGMHHGVSVGSPNLFPQYELVAQAQ